MQPGSDACGGTARSRYVHGLLVGDELDISLDLGRVSPVSVSQSCAGRATHVGHVGLWMDGCVRAIGILVANGRVRIYATVVWSRACSWGGGEGRLRYK